MGWAGGGGLMALPEGCGGLAGTPACTIAKDLGLGFEKGLFYRSMQADSLYQAGLLGQLSLSEA